MKACCTYSLTPVLALVGLVGLGVGGYNWVSTGCPLGSCETPAASMTAASTSEKTGDCALCPAHDTAAVTTVADTSKSADCSTAHDCAAQAKGGECCKGAGQACCQEAAMKECSDSAMKECSDAAKACPEGGKSECPMQKAQEEAKKTETKPTQPS
ncbi:MAG: hypothetical protein IT436_14790 [Phycisphaerales bacterium]|nr:hypothetical protein [Phycisphaerales bacterium]